MGPRQGPAPDLGWPTCWFAGLQAGTTDPSHPPLLRPVFRMFTPVPECSGGRAVVVERGLGLALGVRCHRESRKWENGETGQEKGRKADQKRRACLAEKQEERETQGEAVLRRMG